MTLFFMEEKSKHWQHSYNITIFFFPTYFFFFFPVILFRGLKKKDNIKVFGGSRTLNAKPNHSSKYQ